MSTRKKKYQQIYDLILHWIENKNLRAGEQLPSIRQLAREQNVSKNTVIEAYTRLEQNGIIHARHGAGFYVLAQERRAPLSAASDALQRAYDKIALLTDQLIQPYSYKPGDGRYPREWMRDLALNDYLGASNQTAEMTRKAIEYGNPRGHPELIALLQNRLSAQFPQLTRANFMTTNGINHGFDLIIRHYLHKGDSVIVEAPGYYPLFSKLEMAGIKMLPWTREQPPNLTALESLLQKRQAKMFFLQPYAHNPSGSSLNTEDVERICACCVRCQTQLVIDDPFADLLHNPHPYWPQVIYLSSYSKTLTAALRCGYLIASASTLAPLIKLKTITMINSSAFTEAIVYDLLASGKYDAHIRALKQQLATALAATYPYLATLPAVKIHPYNSGFYLWLELPSGISDMRLANQAAKEDIFLSPGKLFYPHTAPYPALRVNITYADNPRLAAFLRAQM